MALVASQDLVDAAAVQLGHFGDLGQRETGRSRSLEALAPVVPAFLKLGLETFEFGLGTANLSQCLFLCLIRHAPQSLFAACDAPEMRQE
jgi:hypothetical protein